MKQNNKSTDFDFHAWVIQQPPVASAQHVGYGE